MRTFPPRAARALLPGVLGLGALLLPGPVARAGPRLDVWKGVWGRYEVVAGPAALPAVDGALLSFPADTGRADRIWFRWEARSRARPLFSFALRVDSLGLLSPGHPAVRVDRYVLHPGRGRSIEYVDRRTGEALLPSFGFLENLVPKERRGLGVSSRPPGTIVWLGRTFRLVDSGTGATGHPGPDVRRLVLDPDVLVGTSRSFKDDGTGREPGGALHGPADYRWVELAPADYGEMMDAGMNLFRVPEAHLPRVVDRPVFFLTHGGLRDRPEILFRSNYLGAVMYMDEPAIRLLSRNALLGSETPEEAATLLREVTRGRFEGDSGYGQRFLGRMLRRAGYDLGPREVLQPDYPVYEAVAGAAWYELEAGLHGWCYEGRFRPRRFARLVRESLGVDFPEDARSCVLFHYALFRGAARRFGARWGIGIYGQMDPEAAEIVFPLAWERGATYFWFWTSDRDHHLPRDRQLELARSFREHLAGREGDRAGRRAVEAEVALALPWGYHCGEYALRPRDGAREGRLWHSRHLGLGADNGAGATYRDVLAAAFREIVRLLHEGTEFDIVFLRPGETVDGYERVLRVTEGAQVRRE